MSQASKGKHGAEPKVLRSCVPAQCPGDSTHSTDEQKVELVALSPVSLQPLLHFLNHCENIGHFYRLVQKNGCLPCLYCFIHTNL